jgi:predicted RNA-binding protein
MCLSTVYGLGADGVSQKLGEYVSSLRVSGNIITFSELMGREVSLKGTIQNIDLVKKTIFVSPEKDMAMTVREA